MPTSSYDKDSPSGLKRSPPDSSRTEQETPRPLTAEQSVVVQAIQRDDEELLKFVSSHPSNEEVSLLVDHWELWARPNQLPPPTDWLVWLIMAGRGFGKTRAGAEYVQSEVRSGRARYVTLAGRTQDDVRSTMVEGVSGLLTIADPTFRPLYEPSKHRLTWPNGAVGLALSADEPDRFRGPQHELAWADELAAWRYADAWDQLMLGLRLGQRPRVVVTTTPRPTPLIRQLIASPRTYVSRGTTYDNRAHLARDFFEGLIRKYEGTRLGRQELLAEILDDTEGALWQRGQLDALRVAKEPELKRIVVAVDPSVDAGGKHDECGIVVAGKGVDDHGYVLADLSGKLSPNEWAQKAVSAYRKYQAERVIAEINNGGALVEMTLRAVDRNVPYRGVNAARGKRARAEPIAAFYEQGKVHHVGTFARLEDEMCTWQCTGDEPSPNRVDALVWALTEVMLGKEFFVFSTGYR